MKEGNIRKIVNQVPVGYYQNLNYFQKWWHNGKFNTVKELLLEKRKKQKKFLTWGAMMERRLLGLLPYFLNLGKS